MLYNKNIKYQSKMYQMKLTYQRPTITLFRVMSEGEIMANTGGTAKSAPSYMQWDEPAVTEFSTAAKKGGEWE